ncbi:STAS domain-containing protein [Pseudonocardia halophobica]|uniref:Polyvinyl alcohol dehydrogenase n=1 Tax=Pseudonocardia halophobica TaxID=29401 RepID=A0A9W6P0V3_9PSEU|nr:STAS domain-containing protein [Pseudonocardia halophobica]GLL15782.1 polyvinyl alcohol dehydrogenase [Pseudonocardia halophobica]
MTQADGGRVRALLRSGDKVLRRWVEAAEEPLRGRLTTGELGRTCSDLLSVLVEATDGGLDVRTDAYAGARGFLTELSRDWARRGFSPTETASAVFALKDALFAAADEDGDGDLATVLEASRWVDALGLVTFESFARAREQVISEQAEQLLELTTPVVKLWEGVVAVPLIGTLDSARTQIVMEKLLQTLVDTGSEHAIIDITGVPAVDTEVAQHLLKTVVAARLMGAECTISGIRPQIAQTIVTLGIEFGDITTKSTLADALLHAMRGTGVEVVRRAGSR